MKKRNLIILTSILLTIILSTSYAIFVLNTKEYKASELLVSNLLYGIQIDNQNTTTVTTSETKVVTIKITSLNGIDSKYSLEYRITDGNSNAKVYYLNSTTDNPTGEVNKYENGKNTKEIKVVIETDSNVTVEFNVSGGYKGSQEVGTTTNYIAVRNKGYEVTVNVTGGHVDKSPKQVEENGTITFNVTAEDGYTTEEMTVDGECTIDGDTVKAETVTQDMTCTVTLAEDKPTLAEQVYEIMKKQYPKTIDTQRADFSSTNTTASAYYEDGNFIESSIAGADKLMDKVYYYSGAVTNNWVSFAGFYWRIIRTNEDGSLRLLYGGLASESGTSASQFTGGGYYQEYGIGTRYVGFKYGSTGNLINNRGNSTNTTILGSDTDTNLYTLNGWFNQKIKTSYGSYISKTAVYCNDRATSNYQSRGVMTYAALDRSAREISRPSYRCGVDYQGNLIETLQAEEDKFSGMNSSALLKNPIGLMTEDEIVYAGGKPGWSLKSPYAYYYASSRGFSCSNRCWWLMSPAHVQDGDQANVYQVEPDGNYPGGLYPREVFESCMIRPVISLKSCVTLSDATGEVNFADGKEINDPFVVQPISAKCAAANN